MGLLAGMRITAARLWRAQGATSLTTATPAGTATFYQWGTEEVTLGDPGVAVDVTATLTGRVLGTSSAAAGSNITARLGVSTDGGSSWTYGNAVPVDIRSTGVGAGQTRNAVAAGVGVFGVVPTGTIMVRAEYSVSDTNCSMQNGYVTAVATAS